MTCVASQYEAAHADMLSKQDERASAVESLAEDMMYKVQAELSIVLREPVHNLNELTRADIFDLCSSDKFNDLFYSMAEKLIK